jgi:hypothetical protein
MKVISQLLALSLLSVAGVALAADATGKWSGDVHLPNGQTVPFVAHLTQQGDAVTGTLEGMNGSPDVQITDGKVSHETVHFTGVRPINGNEVTFHYTGKMKGTDEIDFRIARADGKGKTMHAMTKRVGD